MLHHRRKNFLSLRNRKILFLFYRKDEEEKKPKPAEPAGNKLTAPVFSGKPKEVNATDGDKVQIECKVTGSPVPEITWFQNKKEIKPSTVSLINFNQNKFHFIW